jgi:hypothetical protein
LIKIAEALLMKHTNIDARRIRNLLASVALAVSAACATDRQHHEHAVELAKAFVLGRYPGIRLTDDDYTINTEDVEVVKVESVPKEITAGGGITVWINKKTGEVIYAKLTF